jgi:hypothetical protein
LTKSNKYIVWAPVKQKNFLYYSEYEKVKSFIGDQSPNVNLLTEFYIRGFVDQIEKISFHGFLENISNTNNYKHLSFDRYFLKKEKSNQEKFFRLKPAGVYYSSLWNKCEPGEIIVNIERDNVYNALIYEDNYGKIFVDFGFSSVLEYKSIMSFLNDWNNLGQNFIINQIVTLKKENNNKNYNSEIIKF